MTRRTWVWDPTKRELVEKGTETPTEQYTTVHGDFKPIISPITGREITDRGALRRHLKAHGMAPLDDVSSVAKRVRAERAAREARDRKQSLVEGYERARDAARARSRFG